MDTKQPIIIRDVVSLRREIGLWHKANLKVAVVPTMGALHDGHLRLVQHGFEYAQRVVATIFVNPKQFAPHEDLTRYPRDEAGDLAKLSAVGTSLIYAPAPDQIYGDAFATAIHVQGPAEVELEDKFRPQFFDGVATIVAKFFVQTAADYAMFGEKDYQQLKVVTRMARDLDLPIEVIGVPTMREADGLAMSSRNTYLSGQERAKAAEIFRVLNNAAAQIRGGSEPSDAASAAEQALTAQGFKADYISARNAETLAMPVGAGEPLRLLAAAWLGKTRLIDNIAV